MLLSNRVHLDLWDVLQKPSYNAIWQLVDMRIKPAKQHRSNMAMTWAKNIRNLWGPVWGSSPTQQGLCAWKDDMTPLNFWIIWCCWNAASVLEFWLDSSLDHWQWCSQGVGPVGPSFSTTGWCWLHRQGRGAGSTHRQEDANLKKHTGVERTDGLHRGWHQSVRCDWHWSSRASSCQTSVGPFYRIDSFQLQPEKHQKGATLEVVPILGSPPSENKILPHHASPPKRGHHATLPKECWLTMAIYIIYIYCYIIRIYLHNTKTHKKHPTSSKFILPNSRTIRKFRLQSHLRCFFVFRQRAGRLGPALSREAYSAHQSGALAPHGKNVADTSPPENLDAWKRIPVFSFWDPFLPFFVGWSVRVVGFLGVNLYDSSSLMSGKQ